MGVKDMGQFKQDKYRYFQYNSKMKFDNILSSLATPVFGFLAYFIGRILGRKKTDAEIDNIKLDNQNKELLNSDKLINLYKNSFSILEGEINGLRVKIDCQNEKIDVQTKQIDDQTKQINKQTKEIMDLHVENVLLRGEVKSLRNELGRYNNS